ncbi:thioredoxin domain-containing protein [Arenimonas oryziterrae]|uniref:Spermatogenesis-associated protein 20-like TRX domain-containing protein n=1 Tax=Arenimonas oryziterrae DSM 21050 = YC6267 TaxID=1121015 RepID=A0A091AXK7_9GAMM|nr:thioredoxin domain-containing protein [Arenimonas oryziterrae]KFN43389.1 hypothetical protein N789_08935 [Arenimonas oryziterrae DSM 21050 = YC6267]
MPNALARESSLYLRQHADNPVDWRAWNTSALTEARRADKPILLSIGYSACHWCHVMAHESFEDEATGRLMNGLFVNIKVDREERPDLDRIYQLAHQALTRRGGGWPLTLFLDPLTLVPFYAGTYFPKTARYGMPAFSEVLQGARQWWDGQRDQVQQQNQALQGFLADYGRETAHAGDLSTAPREAAREKILAHHDSVNGGHRGAPKFPHAGEVESLLSWARQSDLRAGEAAATTLARMASRGLHDQLAGGFFRYCVDEHWDIPHFEKMLYDNAQLLPVYAEAATQFESPQFQQAAGGIVTWLQAEMRADGGGFCSALDADSEGVEGKFYLWTRAQVDAALDTDLREIVHAHYGLDRAPNFENEAWHLHAAKTPAEIAAASGSDAAEISRRLARTRSVLLAKRAERIPPARDDKRLTAWNALLVTGLARAGKALQREDWLDEAETVLDMLIAAMDVRGRLPAVLGSTGPGFLDDHAFTLQAALTVLEARWSVRALRAATQLAETLLSDFIDRAEGGFFFTARDHEALPQRPKPWLDESTPSGNAVAARSLLTLGWLLAEPRYLDAAEATLRAAWTPIAELPQAAPAMLSALAEWQQPTPLVVIRGEPGALALWRYELRRLWPHPLNVYAFSDHGTELPPGLAEKPETAAGRATLCQGTQCLAACDSVEALVAQLQRLA